MAIYDTHVIEEILPVKLDIVSIYLLHYLVRLVITRLSHDYHMTNSIQDIVPSIYNRYGSQDSFSINDDIFLLL